MSTLCTHVPKFFTNTVITVWTRQRLKSASVTMTVVIPDVRITRPRDQKIANVDKSKDRDKGEGMSKGQGR